jgi:hypothetical protein
MGISRHAIVLQLALECFQLDKLTNKLRDEDVKNELKPRKNHGVLTPSVKAGPVISNH